MLTDDITAQGPTPGVGCNSGWFFGSTRPSAMRLLLWAVLTCVIVSASELWRMIDPLFIDTWKQEREEADYSYQSYQFYVSGVIGIIIALTLPVCVYCGISKMNKPLLHMFSGYSMICTFFTFIGAFQYFLMCHRYTEYNPTYCYSLGVLELFTFIAFTMSCSYSLHLIRESVEYSASGTFVAEPQPHQETFSSNYPTWIESTSQPQQTVTATEITNTQQGSTNYYSSNYPTATVVGVIPSNGIANSTNYEVEMATVAATPASSATVTPVGGYFSSSYSAPQTARTSTYFPQTGAANNNSSTQTNVDTVNSTTNSNDNSNTGNDNNDSSSYTNIVTKV
mmetsp:Transcript_36329/g.45414  ORF Transcript_36329/g.45414 Transcript_36329/m.45414 type:complete len:338 (-) Transcript_36329:1912-2925(-)